MGEHLSDQYKRPDTGNSQFYPVHLLYQSNAWTSRFRLRYLLAV